MSQRFFFHILGIAILLGGKSAVAGDLHSDSLAAMEILDSIKTKAAWSFRDDGKRIVKMNINYQGGSGAIPAALGRLDGLRVLRLNICPVTSLPKEIGNLKLLDTLDISATSIGPTIPDEIGGLPNLRYCRVSSSRLTTLPNALLNLKGSVFFDFQSNFICALNDTLKNRILSSSPSALSGQHTEKCATSILKGHSRSPKVEGAFRIVDSDDTFTADGRATLGLGYRAFPYQALCF